MNRHSRRTELRAFRRAAHKSHLLVYKIAADDDASLKRHPLLGDAALFWRSNIQRRRPSCPVCKVNFADGGCLGGFLFATIAGTPGAQAGVVGFCSPCWALPPDVIEREAAWVLQRAIGGGQFLDPR
jgi:hypothetical protein